jgi:hypothetical protein
MELSFPIHLLSLVLHCSPSQVMVALSIFGKVPGMFWVVCEGLHVHYVLLCQTESVIHECGF